MKHNEKINLKISWNTVEIANWLASTRVFFIFISIFYSFLSFSLSFFPPKKASCIASDLPSPPSHQQHHAHRQHVERRPNVDHLDEEQVRNWTVKLIIFNFLWTNIPEKVGVRKIGISACQTLFLSFQTPLFSRGLRNLEKKCRHRLSGDLDSWNCEKLFCVEFHAGLNCGSTVFSLISYCVVAQTIIPEPTGFFFLKTSQLTVPGQ